LEQTKMTPHRTNAFEVPFAVAHAMPPRDPPEVLARVRGEMDLVTRMASMMRRRTKTTLSKEELVSFGSEALLRAARSFDPMRGVPFCAWAAIRVRGSMIDGVRASGHTPRNVYEKLRALASVNALLEGISHEHGGDVARLASNEAEERMGAHLADMATVMAVRLVSLASSGALDGVTEGQPSPEDEALARELRAGLRSAIALLPDAERSIVQLHYFEDVSLDEAARRLGWSRSWGSRLHARAVAFVRRDLVRRRLLNGAAPNPRRSTCERSAARLRVRDRRR
jgi:RNA polymerase sigma factor for flagellar operon FliA